MQSLAAAGVLRLTALPSALLQELLLPCIARHAGGPFELGTRFVESPKLLQEISPNARQQMIAPQCRFILQTIH
jgi:hypothetical protein